MGNDALAVQTVYLNEPIVAFGTATGFCLSCLANSFKPTYRRLKPQPSHAFMKCSCTNNVLYYSKLVRNTPVDVAMIREREPKLILTRVGVENSIGSNPVS